ncbi:MAG: NUDIX domain-containing protein [Streptosporangiales bacterium]|nr:NUDIX domain-containing protein [Streptosporangiales bacterium]
MGAVVRDRDGRLLLIRRGHPPGLGLWSLPGGRTEPGETDEQAVVREVREETGLDVVVGELVGSVERAGPDGAVFDIYDYAATVAGGVPTAGDDASAVRWMSEDELRSVPTSHGLVETLTEWGVLTRPPPPWS